MTYIETIPMCGGNDKAFHVQIEIGAHTIDHFYFCTTEGISTHRSKEHMFECLEETGFAGFLEIKSKAIPTAQKLARLPLPTCDLQYLIKLLALWYKLRSKQC